MHERQESQMQHLIRTLQRRTFNPRSSRINSFFSGGIIALVAQSSTRSFVTGNQETHEAMNSSRDLLFLRRDQHHVLMTLKNLVNNFNNSILYFTLLHICSRSLTMSYVTGPIAGALFAGGVSSGLNSSAYVNFHIKIYYGLSNLMQKRWATPWHSDPLRWPVQLNINQYRTTPTRVCS